MRDGQVANRPVYAAIGVSLAGEKDILDLWAGAGGEGAKFWMSVLTDLKNRGVRDVFFVVCDGLKGLPEVVGNAWPQAIVQAYIVHLIRNAFRLASKRDWDALRRNIKPIYTAVNAEAARAALDQLAETWGQRCGAIIRLWENPWPEFIPFLDCDVEIRKVLCSTNAIESPDGVFRRTTGQRRRTGTPSRSPQISRVGTGGVDVAIHEGDPRALRYESAGNAGADSRGAANNDGDLTFEAEREVNALVFVYRAALLCPSPVSSSGLVWLCGDTRSSSVHACCGISRAARSIADRTSPAVRSPTTTAAVAGWRAGN